jgi:thiamine pyrophosphokinase
MQRRALVVLNGTPPSRPLLQHLASQADLVVAADGGANVLRRFKIPVDVVIGDLDSIQPATRRFFSKAEVIQIPDQNSTDFEKAFGFLIDRKIGDAMVAGMAGKRIDFTLGNFVSVWNFVPPLNLSFFGDGWVGVPVVEEIDLSLPLGTTVSLIPFSRLTGVTLKGFRYPLRKATMDYGSLGVSNVTESEATSIRIKSGKLLVLALESPAPKKK